MGRPFLCARRGTPMVGGLEMVARRGVEPTLLTLKGSYPNR